MVLFLSILLIVICLYFFLIDIRFRFYKQSICVVEDAAEDLFVQFAKRLNDIFWRMEVLFVGMERRSVQRKKRMQEINSRN